MSAFGWELGRVTNRKPNDARPRGTPQDVHMLARAAAVGLHPQFVLGRVERPAALDTGAFGVGRTAVLLHTHVPCLMICTHPRLRVVIFQIVLMANDQHYSPHLTRQKCKLGPAHLLINWADLLFRALVYVGLINIQWASLALKIGTYQPNVLLILFVLTRQARLMEWAQSSNPHYELHLFYISRHRSASGCGLWTVMSPLNSSYNK